MLTWARFNAVRGTPRKTSERKATPDAGIDTATRQRLEVLRGAADARRKLRVDYVDLNEHRTDKRVLRPLGCFFWSAT